MVERNERLGDRVSADGNAIRRLSAADPNFTNTANDALDANNAETQMTLMEGLRTYPKAVMWSVVLSTAIIMEGYDIVLLGSLYAFPAFRRDYGEKLPNGDYQIPAHWQTALSNMANVGEIIGLFINGIVSERYGYRKTMIGALFFCTCFIFILFFAKDVKQLLVGELLCGIPWGVFQTLTTTYAAEVCPVALRPYLTTYVNLCWVIGQLLASTTLRALVGREDQWGYRIPFALQWAWPIPIAIGTLLAPESPWWLVRKGRDDEARKALHRLKSQMEGEGSDHVEKSLSMIKYTNELEKQTESGTHYWDCFRGIDLRRTEITCVTWAIQVTCGSGFMGYSTYFYQQAGLDTKNSFNMSMAQYGIGAIGTFAAWYLMNRMGRRTLYIGGLVFMDICLIVIGCITFAPETEASKWAIGSMLLVFTFIYDVTVGPVCYSLVSELSSTRLRSKTIVLARNFYNVWGIANNFLTPYMLNPGAWNWRAKAGFFWGGFCFLSLIWTYFRLPEPRGRSYAELDVLFENKTSARKFASTKVDLINAVSYEKDSSSDEINFDEKAK